MSDTLSLATPPELIYRIGYEPNPWNLPDWSFATGEPRTFGHRFDDSEGKFRVLYAGSSYLACFVEMLANFRLDPGLARELDEIVVDEDHRVAVAAVTPPGHITTDWPTNRRMGIAEPATGLYADLGTRQSLQTLRGDPRVAAALQAVGMDDLDAAALHMTTPRTVTQTISRVVFEHEPRHVGMHYLSKWGDDLDCWVIFENPSTGQGRVAVLNHESITWTNEEFLKALELLEIGLWDAHDGKVVVPRGDAR